MSAKLGLLILALEGQGAAAPRFAAVRSSLASARCGPVLARILSEYCRPLEAIGKFGPIALSRKGCLNLSQAVGE